MVLGGVRQKEPGGGRSCRSGRVGKGFSEEVAFAGTDRVAPCATHCWSPRTLVARVGRVPLGVAPLDVGGEDAGAQEEGRQSLWGGLLLAQLRELRLSVFRKCVTWRQAAFLWPPSKVHPTALSQA